MRLGQLSAIDRDRGYESARSHGVARASGMHTRTTLITMVDSYLRELRSILDAAVPEAERSATIECKHFFAGAAAYVDGRIFMSLTPVGLALKLSVADRDALMDLGATPLRYFPKAPIKKDYAVLPESIRGDAAALARWINASLECCKTLPAPRKARKTGSPRRSASQPR